LLSRQVVESTLETTTNAFAPGDLRVGADLMEVEQVASSVARFGDRYVRRLFTDHEVSCCRGEPTVVASGLAARFAAKEAVVKVLRPVAARPDWRSIEVRRHEAGWCELRLSGEARRLAEEAGIRSLALSLSHDAGMAAAVVVAVCDRRHS
jgi:holo-[acyl-carrier protein] synthase